MKKKPSFERLAAIVDWVRTETLVDPYGRRHTATLFRAPRKIINLDVKKDA